MYTPIVQRLRDWKQAQGKTSKEIADELGFHPNYIDQLMTGHVAVSDGIRWRFFTTYGPETATELFVNGDDNPA